MTGLIGETVTVERRTQRDRHGDTLPASTHIVDGCVWWFESSDEDHDRRDQLVTRLQLAMPYGADITHRDIVVLPSGGRFEVEGAPAPWRSPFTGWSPGLIANLVAVSG